MRAAERVLIATTGILIVAAIVVCWGIAIDRQSYDRSGTDSGMPWPIIRVQIATTAASAFALVGLASAAGLLFLRADRWTDTPIGDEEPTLEPLP